MSRIFGYLGSAPVAEAQLISASTSMLSGGSDSQSITMGKSWALGKNILETNRHEAIADNVSNNLQDEIYAVVDGKISYSETIANILRTNAGEKPEVSDENLVCILYKKFGQDVTKYLEGSFACAVVDLRNQSKIFLISDSLSKKPLYYKATANGFFFASEVKALACLVDSPLKTSSHFVESYFQFQCLPDQQTPFDEVNKIRPGEIVEFSESQSFAKKYTPTLGIIMDSKAQSTLSFSECSKKLDHLLSDAVEAAVNTHLPLAIQLSGGIDSNLVANYAYQLNRNITGYHINYSCKWQLDETSYAVDAASSIGMDLELLTLDDDDIVEMLPEMVRSLGIPNATPHSLSAYALYKQINRHGIRICLNGAGADELFGGYRRHLRVMTDPSPKWLNNYLDRISITPSFSYRDLYTEEYAHTLEKSPYSKYAFDITKYFFGDSRLASVLNYDIWAKLPSLNLLKADHLSMGSSVEARAPFLNERIVEFATTLPDHYKIDNGTTKRIVYELAKMRSPESILNRNKQPFTLPFSEFLQSSGRVYEYTRQMLTESPLISMGVLNSKKLMALLDMHTNDPTLETSKLIWAILVLSIWFNQQKKPASSYSQNTEVRIIRIDT